MRATISTTRASARAAARPSAAAALHATTSRVWPGASAPATSSSSSGTVSLSARAGVVARAAGKGFGAPKPKSTAAAKKDNKPKQLDPGAKCPCGSGSTYEACCMPFHVGATVKTPEQLLRSRYCAYTLKNAEYIADTTHRDADEFKGTRTAYLKAVAQTQRRMECVSLRVLEQQPGPTENEHFITFKTSFYDKEDAEHLLQIREETSRFYRDGGRWFFMESKFTDKLAADAK